MQCTSERDNDSSGARQKNGCKKREKTGVNYECENRGGGRDTERSQQGGPVVVVFCKVHTLHRYNVIWDGKKTTMGIRILVEEWKQKSAIQTTICVCVCNWHGMKDANLSSGHLNRARHSQQSSSMLV